MYIDVQKLLILQALLYTLADTYLEHHFLDRFEQLESTNSLQIFMHALLYDSEKSLLPVIKQCHYNKMQLQAYFPSRCSS
jgi:hypothetical protein